MWGNKVDKLKNVILHFTLFLFLVIAVCMVYREVSGDRYQSGKVELAGGWNVKVNDVLYENVNLNDFHMPLTKRGDWLVLTSVLPQDLLSNGTLCIYSRDSVVNVYVDGEMILEYGVAEFNENRPIGFGNRMVTLPADAAGKNIKITYLVTESNSFSTISAPIVYNESTVMKDYMVGKKLYLGVAFALIVLGIGIAAITFVLYFKSYTMEKLFCVGVFAFCIGFWTLCAQDLDFLFTSSLRVKAFMQYISFYLMLFPLLLYFRQDVDKRGNRAESLIYYAMLIIEIQMFVISVILQVTNVIHFPEFEAGYYVFVAIALIFMLILIIRSIKYEHVHIILIVGYLIELASAVRDLGAISAIRYFKLFGSEGNFVATLPFASLLFVASMFVDFIYEMRKVLYAAAETEFLIKIAYEDVLTELHTRRKIEEYFAQIERRKQEYLIVQFDLNNLKTTNDNYGHEAGDDLIIRFSNILKATFNNGEILGRMGGDEFIAIVRDSYGYDVEEKLKLMNEAIAEDCATHDPVKVSVSYGYCHSTEFENPNVNEVYKTADKRMYACKEEYYRQTGRGRRRYD